MSRYIPQSFPTTQLLRNPFQHRFEIVKDIAVPIPQDKKALRLEPSRPCLVTFFLLTVKRAIKFDDQSPFQADKVSDKVANRNLTSESTSFELAPTQSVPETALVDRRVVAQPTREFL